MENINIVLQTNKNALQLTLIELKKRERLEESINEIKPSKNLKDVRLMINEISKNIELLTEKKSKKIPF